jgi:hypothetical protein
MTTPAVAVAGDLPEEFASENFLRNQIQTIGASCDKLIRWEHEHMLKGNASPPAREKHREILKFVLRLARLLHAALSDPDNPDRNVAEMLRLAVWKLEGSWRMLYEPKSEAEADKLLREIFPE